MEALAIFGIACNVMQTISFAHEAVKLARDIRRENSIDANLEYRTSLLEICMKSLKLQLHAGSQPMSRDGHELLDIANECLAAGAAITGELAKVRKLSQKSAVHAALAWVKVIAIVRGRLKELDDLMSARQRLLETQLLTRICKSTDAAMIMSQQGFHDLDRSLQHFIAEISRGTTALQSLVVTESASIKAHVTDETERLRQGIQEDFGAHSKRVDDTVSAVIGATQKTQTERQDRERLLRSLRYAGKDARRDQIKDAHDQTFEWIFASLKTSETTNIDPSITRNVDSSSPGLDASGSPDLVSKWDDFVEWLRSDELCPYWISGKPGSGKSTLMLFVAEDSRTMDVLRATNTSPKTLSHYFWAAGDLCLRSAKGFLCSLLHDVLVEDDALYYLIVNKFLKVKWKSTPEDWSLRELETVGKHLFSSSQNHWTIFLDGIDEADHQDQPALLDIISLFRQCSNIKICLSSRPEPHLEHQFQEYPSLRMQDLTRPDIYKYCQDTLGTLNWKDKKEANQVLEEVHEKSSGVFLWVRLVLGQLKQGTLYGEDTKALKIHLHGLPSDLGNLYQQMWSRENSHRAYEEDASRYLNFVMECTSSPEFFGDINIALIALLDSPEILESLVFRYNELLLDELQTSCETTTTCLVSRTAGLIEVSEDGQVTFIHRSAYEFLKLSDFGQSVLFMDKTDRMERLINLVKAYLAFIQVSLERHRAKEIEIGGFETDHSEDICFYQPPFGAHEGGVVPMFADFFGRLKYVLELQESGALKLLPYIKAVYDQNYWGSSYYTRELSVLDAALGVRFFDCSAKELNQLYDQSPTGMRVSVAYERFLFYISIEDLGRSNYEVAAAARFFQLLLERRIDSTSTDQTDGMESQNKLSHQSLLGTDLVLRFLSHICKLESIKNWSFVDRILLGLVVAKCSHTPFFIRFCPIREDCAGGDYFRMKYGVGSNWLWSRYREQLVVLCETNIKTMLTLLFHTVTKPEDRELASIWEETYAATHALAMPILLKVVAVTLDDTRKFFLSRAGPMPDDLCDSIGLDAINNATGSALASWRGKPETRRALLVLPGLSEYAQQLMETVNPIGVKELEEQLSAIGSTEYDVWEIKETPKVYQII